MGPLLSQKAWFCEIARRKDAWKVRIKDHLCIITFTRILFRWCSLLVRGAPDCSTGISLNMIATTLTQNWVRVRSMYSGGSGTIMKYRVWCGHMIWLIIFFLRLECSLSGIILLYLLWYASTGSRIRSPPLLIITLGANLALLIELASEAAGCRSCNSLSKA